MWKKKKNNVQVTLKKKKKLGGHYGKTTLRQFSLIAFPPNLEGKNLWAQGENFLPDFPLPLFSPYFQTEENLVFHSIFLLTFSIPPNIHPTKHSVRVSRMKNQWFTRGGSEGQLREWGVILGF